MNSRIILYIILLSTCLQTQFASSGSNFVVEKLVAGSIPNGSPMPGVSTYTGLHTTNGLVFFVAYDNKSGYELWRTDGTSEGTILIKDMNPGKRESNILKMISTETKVFVHAGCGEIWTTEGQINKITKLFEHPQGKGCSSPIEFVKYKTGVSFSVIEEGSKPSLWISDGTKRGTKLVATIDSPAIQNLIAINNTLFFTTPYQYDCSFHALWKSDGTASGTELISTIPSQPSSREALKNALDFPETFINWNCTNYAPSEMTVINDDLFFTTGNFGHTRSVLWTFDSKSQRTFQVNDFGSYGLRNFLGVLVFNGEFDSINRSHPIYALHSSQAALYKVNEIIPGYPEPIYKVEFFDTNFGMLYSLYNGSDGYDLWLLDQYTSEPTLLASSNIITAAVSDSTQMLHVTVLKDRIFFNLDDGIHGNELWTVNNLGELQLVIDVIEGEGHGDPYTFVSVGSSLYFTAGAGYERGRELWKVTIQD